MFQAIVSVIAVKIQFNSPTADFLSIIFPGIKSTELRSMLPKLSLFSIKKNLRATGRGVVKQLVNKSAGKSGFIGSNSPAAHGARTMQFLTAFMGSEVVDPEDEGVALLGSEGGVVVGLLGSNWPPVVGLLGSNWPPSAGLLSVPFSCCPAISAVKKGSKTPALLQSKTTMLGVPIQLLISKTLRGMYCV